MGDAVYLGVLIIGALIGVAFLTLVSLLLYKVIISRRIVKRQVVSVFVLILILDGVIGLSSYYDEGSVNYPIWYGAVYFLTAIGLGMLVARLTRAGQKAK